PAATAHVTLILDSKLRLAGDADAAVEPGRIPGVAQARHLDHVAGVRGVDELAAADVDPDVAQAVEEHEIAGGELAGGDVDAGGPEVAGVVRQAATAGLGVGPHHEAGAVESTGARAAPHVRNALLAERDGRGPRAEARRGRGDDDGRAAAAAAATTVAAAAGVDGRGRRRAA